MSQNFSNYVENGSIYIFSPKLFIKKNNRLAGKISIFEMQKWQSVDIDYNSDFLSAEEIFKKKLNYK